MEAIYSAACAILPSASSVVFVIPSFEKPIPRTGMSPKSTTPHQSLFCIVLRRWTQCEYSGSYYRILRWYHFNYKLLWIHSYKLMGGCYECNISFDWLISLIDIFDNLKYMPILCLVVDIGLDRQVRILHDWTWSLLGK